MCDFVFEKTLRLNWGKVCCRPVCFFPYLDPSSDCVTSGQMWIVVNSFSCHHYHWGSVELICKVDFLKQKYKVFTVIFFAVNNWLNEKSQVLKKEVKLIFWNKNIKLLTVIFFAVNNRLNEKSQVLKKEVPFSLESTQWT